MAGTKHMRTMLGGQDLNELRGLVAILKDEGVKSILEIGSRYGDVLREMSRQTGADVVSIDMPNGPWGRSNSESSLREHIEHIRRDGRKARLIIGNSQSQEIVEKAREYAPFDFIFIDADHQYEGVKKDWENYGPMGRLVAFHDISGDGLVNGTGQTIGVGKLWNQIKNNYRHVEIIERPGSMGIGVLWVSETKS